MFALRKCIPRVLQIKPARTLQHIIRPFHPEFTNNPPKDADKKQEAANSLQEKYKVFKDEDATEIFDVEEEKLRFQDQEHVEEVIDSKYLGLNLERELITNCEIFYKYLLL